MDKLIYHVWLNQLFGVENKKIDILLNQFDAKEIYNLTLADLKYTKGLTRADVDLIRGNKDLTDAEKIISECRRLSIKIIASYMDEFPKRLENMYSPPHILYIGGDLGDIDSELCISIVGTRSCSSYGRKVAYNLGYNLAKSGCIVISGIAKGIDTAAVEGAMDAGGKTIAVLGNGVNVAYPPQNALLMKQISQNGAVVSEFPPHTEPYKTNFPKRNRIISGLALGVVIVEAPKKSGALITASYALEQGRDVFCVPGNIDDIRSEGSNSLIRDGARLVRNSEDILFEYRYFMPEKIIESDETLSLMSDDIIDKKENKETQKQQKTENKASVKKEYDFSKLTQDEEQIARLLIERDMTITEILAATDLNPSKINSTLTIMEVNGIVDKKINRKYRLIQI